MNARARVARAWQKIGATRFRPLPRRTNPIITSSALLIFSCAAQSRLAPYVEATPTPSPNELANSMVVPYPPPAAIVETMAPAPPDVECVYVDGQWTFGARDWQWVPGSWVKARTSCAFARARVFWQTAGADRSELRFRAGRWVQRDNPGIDCPPAAPCPGSTAIASP